MLEEFNYDFVEELRRLEEAFVNIFNKENSTKDDLITRKRLLRQLKDLRLRLDLLTLYIKGKWNETFIDSFFQKSLQSFNKHDYKGYLSNQWKAQQLMNIKFIAANQTIEQRNYFLSEYDKYKDEKKGSAFIKIR